MEINYKSTIRSSFMGYVVQAITNNFAPLLFLTFETQYGIPMEQITILITVCFIIQLFVDLASAFFVDKIGYRAAALLAHGFASIGLVFLGILPNIMQNAFIGLLISVICYAIGGGLLEVIVSPMVEACPSDNKEKTMGLLHSVYSWGCVALIGLSTLFFNVVGIKYWWILSIIWAIVPLVNGLTFIKVPLAPVVEGGGKGLSIKELFKMKIFWVLIITMICAGASELSIAQWSSAFAESALGLSKSVSDLIGPMIFALMMAITRVVYGKFVKPTTLDNLIIISCVLCIGSFLIASLATSPIIGLIGVALSGVSVAILWPGTFSSASASIKTGGTAMFAILALGGDLGAAGGPTFVGMISGAFGDNLKIGILCATVFPTILIICMLLAKYIKKKKTISE